MDGGTFVTTSHPYQKLIDSRARDMAEARAYLAKYRESKFPMWRDWFLMHARSHRAYSRLLWERGYR